MDKVRLLRAVNIVLFFLVVVQAVTGGMILFRIKTAFTGLVFEVHEYNGLLLAALVIMHITLNWGWVRTNLFEK